MFLNNCKLVSMPTRYRYKPTPFKNYFKVFEPIVTSDPWLITVPSPTRILLTEFVIFGNEVIDEDPTVCVKSIPNLKLIQEHFLTEGRLEIKAALRIVQDAGELFQREPTLLELNRPITFVGDISGQYYDLITLLKLGGCLDRFKYLFLGDYVNGSYFSTECIIHLCALKLNYPDKIYLLRGNNETRISTEFDLFKKECDLKYNTEFYEKCIQTFNKLPVAAVIDNRFFCAHGGISPNICTLDDIRKLNRFCEPELDSGIFDILWSDPIPDYNTNTTTKSFEHNECRGGSYYYTYAGLQRFLDNNNLHTLIRGHEMCVDGFRFYLQSQKTSMPSVISILSAPNCHDTYGNKGAIIQYDNCNFTVKQYASVSHPFCYHNFENGITLTLAFVAQRVTDILLALLKNCIEGGTDDMYMANMRQNREGAICCKQSVELDKILQIKKSIRLVCKISKFYGDIKNEKLSFAKSQRKEEKKDDGELKVFDKYAKKLTPKISMSKINFAAIAK